MINMLKQSLAMCLLFIINLTTLMSQNNGQSVKNVLGKSLITCCTDPLTGFYRNGRCKTGPEDYGTHVVCALVTKEFLEFTKTKGNDLSTPRPEYNFPGLEPGDRWCLCALRWKEAYEHKSAPKVILESTHEKALEYIDLEILEEYAL